MIAAADFFTTEVWTARGLVTDSVDGFLTGNRFLIIDRDNKFTVQFEHALRQCGVSVLLTSYQAPNMNAFAERDLCARQRRSVSTR